MTTTTVGIQVSREVEDLLYRYAQSEGLIGDETTEEEGGVYDGALKMLLSSEDIENDIENRKEEEQILQEQKI